MNFADLVVPAGAGSTDRWVRSFDMDQLISRKSRDMQHFGEVDWTILGWQDRRVPNGTGAHAKDSEDIGNTDTIIGVIYVGVLVLLMLVYLT
jgi:hypothetical protein